jgi:hypothetical protein
MAGKISAFRHLSSYDTVRYARIVFFVGSFRQGWRRSTQKKYKRSTNGKMAITSAFRHLSLYDTPRYTRIVLFAVSFRQVGDVVQKKEVQMEKLQGKWPSFLLSVM